MSTIKGNNTYLVIDSREHAVIPFIETEVQKYKYVQKQINTGDYLICRNEIVLACIERKTHEDFAASFKDGRYDNIKKMIALRASTGCQLYFFIEGPAFPNPNRKFARIPFNNILAAITKLMIRDGIFIVQTEDQRHSAKRLADFLHVFDMNEPTTFPTLAIDIKEPTPVECEKQDIIVPDALTARINHTDDESAVIMWSNLHGISIVFGKILTREFTVSDLATNKITPDKIKALKTSTGRPVHKDAITSLLAVKDGSFDHAVKIISSMRNITPATAKIILESIGSLSQLCNCDESKLAAVLLPQKNRTIQLGKIRSQYIKRMLCYKAQPAVVLPIIPPPLLDSDVNDILNWI